MRIIYAAMVNKSMSGVEKKIISQFDALKRIRDTSLYLLMNGKPDKHFFQEIADRKIRTIYPESSITNPIKRRKNKLDILSKKIIEEFSYEDNVIYFRYPLADSLFYKFLKKMKDYYIVTEHQIPENKIFLEKKLQWRLLPEIIWGKSVRKKIDGFVGVTQEIIEYQKMIVGSRKFKGIVIGNGITTCNESVRNYKVNEENIIKLLFVGTPYPPHGLDRLIKSIGFYRINYPERRPVVLSVVGYSKYIDEYKKMVIKFDIEKYVKFYGFRSGKELNYLYNTNDIAVGHLASHRIKITETSELKAREYCTKGIPFICSSPDNDFPSSFPYRLQVSRGEAHLDINEIVDFVLRCRRSINHPIEMHEYSCNNLDWNKKINRLIKFLDEIITTIT
ncbi:MAG TPA: glycosyltransferase [Thermotogota bacterium]|nr:glycosyltransferase [Thermotogota bacterium]